MNLLPFKYESGSSATKQRGLGGVDIRCQVGNCGICGGQTGTGDDTRACTVAAPPDHHTTCAPYPSIRTSVLSGGFCSQRTLSWTQIKEVNFKITFTVPYLAKSSEIDSYGHRLFPLIRCRQNKGLQLKLCVMPYSHFRQIFCFKRHSFMEISMLFVHAYLRVLVSVKFLN